MKFFIQRDKTVGEKLFIVFDEQGREKYFVTGSKNTCFIKFFVNTSSKTPSCYFFGNSWLIRGDILTNTFDVIDSDNSLVASHRVSFSEKKGYELEIISEHNELFCIATAVCVDIEAKVGEAKPLKMCKS